MSSRLAHAILGLFCLAGALHSAEAGAAVWITDFPEALKTAEADSKDVLADFTGSDWCPHCIELKNRVFTQAAFVDHAPDRFVLLSLDYPQRTPQPAALRQANAELAKRFHVAAWPTVLLLDARGRPYARASDEPGDGAAAYLQGLDELRGRKAERDAKLAAADQLQGIDQATAIVAVLDPLLADELLVGYDDLVATVAELDAKDSLGFKARNDGYHRLIDIAAEVERTRDLPKAIDQLTTFLAAAPATGANTQRALFLKGAFLNHQPPARGKEVQISELEVALKAAPDTALARQISDIIKAIREH